ncbi:MAG: glycerophosphodiester phosphodiesterase [Elusimicrobia bacterium]|nr:glycerophosphodiester phosphodiesterase [Elusimicrobiota bacterium]
MLAILLSAVLSNPVWGGLLVHGHRGSRGTRPENTLAAFKEALRVGVDVLELDLAVTKDDVLVVTHDPRLEPEICLGPDGKPGKPVPIRSLTLAEVRGYDCGSLKNPRFPRQVPAPGEKVPTLAEVFELVAKTKGAEKVQFNIETKIFPAYPEAAPAPDDFAELVIAAVAEAKLTERVIVQSFDRRTLEAVKAVQTKLRTAQLTSDNLVDFAALASGGNLDFISPDYQWVTKADVDELHRMKVEVAPWTVNDEAGWAKMVELGVDAVITDYPEDLVAWLKKRGLRK